MKNGSTRYRVYNDFLLVFSSNPVYVFHHFRNVTTSLAYLIACDLVTNPNAIYLSTAENTAID